VCADAHEEEPEAQAPHPESGHVSKQLEEEAGGGTAHVPVGHDFCAGNVAKLHDAGNSESAGANRDELDMLAVYRGIVNIRYKSA
jgi:hypothetical protein